MPAAFAEAKAALPASFAEAPVIDRVAAHVDRRLSHLSRARGAGMSALERDPFLVARHLG